MNPALKTLAALFTVLILPVAAQASEVVLRVGQQKGLTKAMLQSAGQLDNLTYRLEWAEFPASAFTLEAMAADQIDVASVGDGPLIFAVGAGAAIRPIASVRYIDRGEGNVILVKKDSGIEQVSDLRGKKVATTRGSSGHQLLLAALRDKGLTAKDLTTTLLAPADGKAAFDSGDVDAWAVWQPYVAIALSTGDSKVLVSSGGLLSEYAFIAANEKAIEHKQDALQDYVKRVAAATAWSEENLEEYLTIESRLTGLNRDILRDVHRSMRPDIKPLSTASVAGLQSTLQLYAEAGILRRPLALKDFFPAALIEQYEAEQATSTTAR